MCAYKLVTVKFKWWGLQNKIENFIQKVSRIWDRSCQQFPSSIFARAMCLAAWEVLRTATVASGHSGALTSGAKRRVRHSLLGAVMGSLWARLLSVICTSLQQERRLFTNFHRQLFCWLDKWVDLTMEDIRRMEEETKRQLDEVSASGSSQRWAGGPPGTWLLLCLAHLSENQR